MLDRIRLHKKLLTLLTIVPIVISVAVLNLTKDTQVYAQDPDARCIARGVANYMNQIIAGAGSLSHIRLLSPVFNLTSPFQMATFVSMRDQYGANFSGLDGFAGNTYTLRSDPNNPCAFVSSYDFYVNNGWKSAFAPFGRPVMWLEWGDFRLRNPGRCSGQTRQDILNDMAQRFATAANDSGPNIASISLFNALGTSGDDRFAFNIMSAEEIGQVTAARRADGGVNSAVFVEQTNGNFAQQVANLGLGLRWTVGIINGPWELNSAVAEASAAHSRGLTPIFRICTADSCGFTDPQVYVTFLQQLNQRVSQDVWVVAGPNEPDTELWASPNCEPQIPPYVPSRVACSATTDPEYHGFRPYPASPCDDRLLQVTSDCGNDLIIRHEFTYSATDCPETWNGNIKECTIDAGQQSYPVSIDLSAAELPIAGNTQAVPNEVNAGVGRPYNMPYNQRVNEYISWYLEGVKESASERAASESDIDYAGPIRKLLPDRVQRYKRKIPYTGARIGNDMHNQIAGCIDDNGRAVPCISIPGQPIQANIYRLEELRNAIPLEENYPAILFNLPGGFMEAYRNWQASPEGRMYWFLPFKTTEDRPGLVWTSAAQTQPVDGRESGGVNDNLTPSNPVFVPDPDADKDPLFFAHMAEDADLARVLMGTYLPAHIEVGSVVPDTPLKLVPRDVDRCTKDGRVNLGDDLYGELSGADFTIRYGAANTVIPNPVAITGTVIEPEVTVSCRFTVNTDNCAYRRCLYGFDPAACPGAPGCDCWDPTSPPSPPGDENSCKDKLATDCVDPRTNQHPASYTALSVYTETPRVDDIWLRLVTAPYSVYSRIMPEHEIPRARKGEHFLDVPAVTRAVYSSSSADAEIFAGAPNGGRSGDSAELYIPHLGGVYDYFLKTVQTSLLPYGYGPNYLYAPPGGNTPPGVVPPNSCPVCTEASCPCTVENLMTYFTGTDQERRDKATIAAMICYRESRGDPNVVNRSCVRSSDGLNNDSGTNPTEPAACVDLGDIVANSCQEPYLDGATADYSVGLFQINLHPRASATYGATCPGAWARYTGPGTAPLEYCSVANQTILDQCVADLQNPVTNIQRMVAMSQNGTNWWPWHTDVNSCGINY